jgi:VIT1/CCC1 family predicted Fe2+/Mn2+ transporter
MATTTATDEKQGRIRGFFATYLAPVDSLSEVIFGLIMVLGFTSTARLVFGQTSVRRLLLAVIGCNLAWALVDGVMYILASVYERGQRTKFIRSVHDAPDEEAAMALAAEHLDSDLEEVLSEEERGRVYGWIAARAHEAQPERAHIERDDLLGAVASGALVFLAVLPVAAPFLIISDPWVALRVSNLVTVGMLFLVGFYWARHTDMNRVVAGALLLALGVLLVAVTVALGG